jgi:uncharacterized protein involved in exopolysaccharide biosynthesis/Mrp family chromosome partitioning ATPase
MGTQPVADADRISFPAIGRLIQWYAPLFVGIVLASLLVAWITLVSKDPRFEAVSTLVLEPIVPRLDPGQTEVRRASLTDSEVATELEVMRSEILVANVAEAAGLFADPDFVGDVPITDKDDVRVSEVIVPRVLSMFWLDFRPGVLAIYIRVTDVDPARAARIANGLAEGYIDYTRELQQGGLRTRIGYLEDTLVQVRQKLTDAELDAAAFIRVHDLDNTLVQPELIADVERLIAQIEMARSQGNPVGDLEQQKAAIDAVLKERSAAELALVQLERQLERLSIREDIVSDQLDALQAQLSVLAPAARQIAVARVPLAPSYPNIWTGLVGAGVGSAAVAFVAVLLAASFDPRIRETRRYAALGLAPIGRIPRLPRPERQSLWGVLRRYSGSPPPLEHDTVRHALTALRRKRRQEGCMTLLVTAASRGEGLSTTVAAIASAEASSGMRVLVIDLEQGGHGISTGLSTVRSTHSFDELTASAELMRREIAPPGGDVGFFLVAPATVRPASGNLKRERVTELHIVQREQITLEPLKARFDLIVIEVPPVLNDTTALKLATLADETVLVVGMNKARLSTLAQAASVLRSSFIEPVGTIENHG